MQKKRTSQTGRLYILEKVVFSEEFHHSKASLRLPLEQELLIYKALLEKEKKLELIKNFSKERCKNQLSISSLGSCLDYREAYSTGIENSHQQE